MEHAQSLTGMEGYCFRAFAEAMEIIPYTLAENAGLNPIAVVTELRNKHVQGEKSAGINVRKVCQLVVAPFCVTITSLRAPSLIYWKRT